MRAAEHPVQPTVLLLASDHPLNAIEHVARHMAQGLTALGQPARVLSLPRDLAALQALPPHQVAGAIALGPLPLAHAVRGRPLWHHLPCPVSIYMLDAFIYDLARVPAMAAFVTDAMQDTRLGLLSPETGYRNWLAPHLGLRWQHLPFGAFPALNLAEPAAQPQARLAVVGTIGSELGGGQQFERLDALLAASFPAHAPRGASWRDVAAHLCAPHADAMPVRALAQALELPPTAMLTQPLLRGAIAVDSWVKRLRRLLAVQSLAGVPVDFFGTGWREVLGEVPGFRHVGTIRHDHIARLAPHYRALLNFDPNWAGGLHDRVFTALAAGSGVVTNDNPALAHAELPEDRVLTYPANDPHLAERVLGWRWWTDGPATQSPDLAFAARHGWAARMALAWTHLAGAPAAAVTA